MITGTELRVLRQNCGLTQEDVAKYIGCGLRSVKRWESGKSRIPQRIFDRLFDLRVIEQHNSAVMTIFFGKIHTSALIFYDESDADLCDYDKAIPFNAWRHIIVTAYNSLRASGYSVRLVKFDRDDYFAFLDGREDTDYLRAKWAEVQIAKDKAP